MMRIDKRLNHDFPVERPAILSRKFKTLTYFMTSNTEVAVSCASMKEAESIIRHQGALCVHDLSVGRV